MDFPHDDSTILPISVSSPHHAQFVVPNSQNAAYEPTTTAMDFSDYDSSIITARGGHTDIAITIKYDQCPPPPSSTPNRLRKLFDSCWDYLIYTGALVIMFPSLTNFVQLKYQNNKRSPFETHAFFINTAVVAYIIVIPISGTLFCLKAYLETFANEPLVLMRYIYMILRRIFCFLGILAPLSLVLVLLIPDGFNWVGYLIIFLFFVTIVAYSFGGNCNVSKKEASKLGTVQREAA